MAYPPPADVNIVLLAKQPADRCQIAVKVAGEELVPDLLAESDAALLAAPYSSLMPDAPLPANDLIRT